MTVVNTFSGDIMGMLAVGKALTDQAFEQAAKQGMSVEALLERMLAEGLITLIPETVDTRSMN